MTKTNDKAYNILKNSIKKNIFSHFYIFYGPANTGKEKLAYDFSKLLLCSSLTDATNCNNCENCKKIDKKKHFDIVFINSKTQIEGLEDNKSDQIRLPHVHEIIRLSNLGPFMGEYKIFIIDSAEKLNNESSNAFLKHLEEPPKTSIFLFLVNDLSAIYPTIISRAQKISLSETSEEDMNSYLTKHYELDEKTVKKIICFSQGKIGLAKNLSMTPTMIDDYYESYDRFYEFCESGTSERMLTAQKFSSRFRTDRNVIYRELNLWIDFCNIILKNNLDKGNDSIFEKRLDDIFEVEEINNIVLELLRTLSNLKNNANSRLVFDVMSLNIPIKG